MELYFISSLTSNLGYIRYESLRVVKAGFKKLSKGKVQKYKCQECKKNFTGEESYHRLDKEKLNHYGLKVHRFLLD